MSLSLYKISENSLENFDTHLQIFYHEILAKELDVFKSDNVIGVRKALKDVVHAYKKGTVDSNASEIRFDSQAKRCAYVLKHCPCFSSAVAKHFFRLLKRNSGLLHQAFYQRQINLCCLGGGPGTEAVAIIKIVDLIKNYALLRNKEKIHLRVIEVDLSEEWKATAELVLRTAQRNSEFCDCDRIRISFELIKADLTEPLKEDVRRALHEAHIITMVYFVSAVNGSKAQKKCIPMLQETKNKVLLAKNKSEESIRKKNIMEHSKPEALLFFLDSAKNLHFDSIMDSVNKFQNLRLIYGPVVQEFHTLSIKSIKKFFELYSDHFSGFIGLTNCFITCACWVKEVRSIECIPYRDFIAKDGLFSNNPNFLTKENRKWNKMVEQNTKRQERFRQRVERLLMSEMKMNFETDDREDIDYMCDIESLFCSKTIFYAGKAKSKRITLALE